ncbi:MAG: capsular polysaccharide biosynthesis protein [Candidatus Accumulibacter sp. UW25]|jgi:capsular polysaccharide export protein
MLGVTSRGILRLPFLSTLVGEEVTYLGRWPARRKFRAMAGWGYRPSTLRSRALARRRGIGFIALEDGYLRSSGSGEHFPPLSLVVDEEGIYYDSTRPSALERLLNSAADVLAGLVDEVARAKSLLLGHRLSKYNHAPLCSSALLPLPPVAATRDDCRDALRVLVIDQTAGDLSVALGGADADTFATMLGAARAENPQAMIYVKTHPEVSAGHKRGYLTQVQDDERTRVLRQAINPLSLIEQMDRVYVVTSTMGFEALLAGKPVTVFGRPWYAGWGSTDDRQPPLRRHRTRSVDELFAAAYFHYARYLDPLTHQRGTIFHVIDWLLRQREHSARYPGRMIGVGFQRWKEAHIRPLLSLDPGKVVLVPGVAAAAALAIQPTDCLVCWGSEAPAGLQELATRSGARVLHMEDGFVRSVGLGSDFIRPLSLVLDQRGLYFDPTQPSDLEHLLATARFSDDELMRARQVRAFIVEHGITKYNLDPREPANWPTGGREVVLVPGQVEDDASIVRGCTEVRTNLGLLQAARRAHPASFIVYKPHPDVMSGNRAGKLAMAEAQQWADQVETRLSVVSCIAACDVVHTMTSLSGFDALLRGKRVVVHGQPFYAGWGLTEDRVRGGVALGRRERRLQLDELVAGTLLRYPVYWDWDLQGYTTCEAVLRRLLETRDALAASGELEKLRVGLIRRQWRKLVVLLRAWATPGLRP